MFGDIFSNMMPKTPRGQALFSTGLSMLMGNENAMSQLPSALANAQRLRIQQDQFKQNMALRQQQFQALQAQRAQDAAYRQTQMELDQKKLRMLQSEAARSQAVNTQRDEMFQKLFGVDKDQSRLPGMEGPTMPPIPTPASPVAPPLPVAGGMVPPNVNDGPVAPPVAAGRSEPAQPSYAPRGPIQQRIDQLSPDVRKVLASNPTIAAQILAPATQDMFKSALNPPTMGTGAAKFKTFIGPDGTRTTLDIGTAKGRTEAIKLTDNGYVIDSVQRTKELKEPSLLSRDKAREYQSKLLDDVHDGKKALADYRRLGALLIRGNAYRGPGADFYNFVIRAGQNGLGIFKDVNMDETMTADKMRRAIVLSEKNRLKLGAQGFTDSDRKFINSMITDFSDTRSEVAHYIAQNEIILNHKIKKSEFIEDMAAKYNGNYAKATKAWDMYLKSPQGEAEMKNLYSADNIKAIQNKYMAEAPQDDPSLLQRARDLYQRSEYGVQQKKPGNNTTSQIKAGATAINPTTGQRIIWDGQQWKPIQ
jgi:hypothetical protein